MNVEDAGYFSPRLFNSPFFIRLFCFADPFLYLCIVIMKILLTYNL